MTELDPIVKGYPDPDTRIDVDHHLANLRRRDLVQGASMGDAVLTGTDKSNINSRVLVENSATGCGLCFQAAWWYSLMRPPRTVRRWIRLLGIGKAITLGSSFGARSCMPRP